MRALPQRPAPLARARSQGDTDEMGEDAPAARPVQHVERDIDWEAQGAYEVLAQFPCSWTYVCTNYKFRTNNMWLI